MTATAPVPLETSQRILEAACALVVRDGYANLTLDAVAREANVSKGGLLYHFPSKRALLEGMVQHRCQQFEQDVQRHLQRETGRGRWLRAIIRASCEPKEIPLQEGAAIFAVLANDPELLELVRQHRRRFEERIEEDGLDPEQAALWSSTVVLSERFFAEIVAHPVPVDMRALRALKRSPLALDIYAWLTYRNSCLKQPVTIPWPALAAQFGSGYAEVRFFRRAFLVELHKVITVYSAVRLDVAEAGVTLKPSPPHVPRLR